MARAAKRNGPRPLTVYPGGEVRDALALIQKQDHGRPIAHVAEMALKAFAVLFTRDKYEAMKLVDAFDHRTAPTTR